MEVQGCLGGLDASIDLPVLDLLLRQNLHHGDPLHVHLLHAYMTHMGTRLVLLEQGSLLVEPDAPVKRVNSLRAHLQIAVHLSEEAEALGILHRLRLSK